MRYLIISNLDRVNYLEVFMEKILMIQRIKTTQTIKRELHKSYQLQNHKKIFQ